MLTHHAQTRMQQRSIPMSAVDILLAYGKEQRQHGADVLFLTKRGRTEIRKSYGKETFLKLEKALNTYLVIADDGSIITAAHRHHRFKF